ncbi:ninjurin-2-like isoform X2 [Macrobrachium nipponense]|uniref:ninjurin-2-like isoform X2 n=1 Tax=Macrobrachium nipponense TaxID=159736 RepID=UPI0030C89D16
MYGQFAIQQVNEYNGDRFNGKMNDPQVMTVGSKFFLVPEVLDSTESNRQRQGGKTLDPNKYATKKTIAQGMLDIALLTANASQLKYVLQLGKGYEFYSVMLGLIITSLVLQLVAAAMSLTLTMCRDCNLHDESYRFSALCINHFNLICVFIIAVLNIIISAFGVAPSNVKLDVFIGE